MKWYDEMSLFLPGKIFYMEHSMYPGGLITYLGCWLTQFFYYPYLGTTIILILWLIMARLSRFCFGLRGKAWPLTLIVPLFLLVSIVTLDEGLMSFKSEGYVFSGSIGFLFTLVSFTIYRLASYSARGSMLVGTLITLFYGIAGYYALLSALLCIVSSSMSARRSHYYKRFIEAAIILAFLILIPILYYYYLPGNLSDYDYLYLKGLPPLMMESYDLYLWLPFMMASLILLIFPVITGLMNPASLQSAAMKWSAVAAVCACAIWGVIADRKSEQLRATVLMLKCMELNEWQKIPYILSLTRQQPSYTMLIMNNLALTYLGRQAPEIRNPELMFRDLRHSENFTMTGFVQVPVNYYIGRFNQSYRWSMEHTAQYGKRVFFLKYMVKNALLRGEIQLARKYNDYLLSTMYHRAWASGMQKYIDNPALIKQNEEFTKALEMQKIEMRREE